MEHLQLIISGLINVGDSFALASASICEKLVISMAVHSILPGSILVDSLMMLVGVVVSLVTMHSRKEMLVNS